VRRFARRRERRKEGTREEGTRESRERGKAGKADERDLIADEHSDAGSRGRAETAPSRPEREATLILLPSVPLSLLPKLMA
jgi:hypothetical protein